MNAQQGLGKLLHDKRALAAIAAVAILAFIYLRRGSSSSSSSVTNANAVDPATGLTYSAEEQAALAAQASGGGISLGGSNSVTPTADQITTSDGTSVAAALEGLTTGLTALQTAQANEQTQLQSQAEAAAQLTQAVTNLTSLGAPGPTTVTNYNAPVNNSGGGDTVYQAPVTVNEAPAPAPAPVAPPPAPSSSGKSGGQSSPPKASTPAPTAPVVKSGGSTYTQTGAGPYGKKPLY